jgi:hypothetical protein
MTQRIIVLVGGDAEENGLADQVHEALADESVTSILLDGSNLGLGAQLMWGRPLEAYELRCPNKAVADLGPLLLPDRGYLKHDPTKRRYGRRF